ncbi:AAA family ATPase [Clostridium aestuarii]|uniref:AAA family ATPase n=2 Tax=Clostridium aestuarii TaxID=338193 RepID=A0ABT4D1L1_9CLOT|nr:AAA family ATPase [Clostridium aestuarii]MCY6485133.1 AAA family ATPase [Clostridium aestuarii]
MFPDMESIEENNINTTEGEKYLLNFLNTQLNSSYEIYFKPNINGDKPQIVVISKNRGIIIIGIKEWKLDSYYCDNKGDFRKKKDFKVFRSPFSQVQEHKNNMYNLHSKSLLKKSIEDSYAFNLVRCAVYFHNETNKNIKKFIIENDKKLKNKCEVFGRDSLNTKSFFEMFDNINSESKFFDDNVYDELKKYLNCPIHKCSQGKSINYSNKQITIIKSKKENKKIKGTVGSGKTLLLAQRAVNANIRTKNKVLILTHNIALRNYIYNKINCIREEFYWKDFEINNYHVFIKFQLNNIGIPFQWDSDFESDEIVKHLESYKETVEKYDSIFIDEVQDYKLDWLRIIKKYFLKKNGEYVLFGDEKQNAYIRELENNKTTKTNILGSWNVLEQSFRLPTNLATLAIKFQKKFLSSKYNLDNIYCFSIQKTMWDEQGKIDYKFYNNFDAETVYYNIIKKQDIKIKNICIVSTSIDKLKKLNSIITKQTEYKTEIMFETEEEYIKLQQKLKKQYRDRDNYYKSILKNQIGKIRYSRKYNFKAKSGKINLAIIDNFKGWEIDSLVFIIDNIENVSEELIYTGITRARKNLVIVNIGNYKYHKFFKEI